MSGSKAFLVLVGVLLTGCSGLEASSFDQTCDVDDDCAVVFSGDYCADKCGDCDCPNSAISRKAVPDYEWAKTTMLCAPEFLCPVCDCLAVTAVCEASTCTAVDTSAVRTDDE